MDLIDLILDVVVAQIMIQNDAMKMKKKRQKQLVKIPYNMIMYLFILIDPPMS